MVKSIQESKLRFLGLIAYTSYNIYYVKYDHRVIRFKDSTDLVCDLLTHYQ